MEEKKQHSELICVPGQRLCLADENTVAGQGTYERQGYVYSLLVGVVEITEKEKVNSSDIEYFCCIDLLIIFLC